MGKLAEIKDMEEVVDNKEEAADFQNLIEKQEKHNTLMEKLMKLCAGCAVGIFAVILAAVLLVVPKGLSILGDVKDITAQIDGILPQAQEVITQVKESDLKGLVDNLNSTVQKGGKALDESVEELKKAVEVVEKIDIEAFNTAVDNLGKAVRPLARLFGGK